MTRYTCPCCGAVKKSVHIGPDAWECPDCGKVFCTAAGIEADEFWKNVREYDEVPAEED